MQQAARSEKQNIVEGGRTSGTSKETEIKLSNVARASLEELKIDNEDSLRVHHLKYWNKSHPCYAALTIKHKTPNATYNTYRKGIKNPDSEVSANVLLSLVNVTSCLLAQQLKTLERKFPDEGGWHEPMSQTRMNVRKKQN